jgi:hypothetical protein
MIKGNIEQASAASRLLHRFHRPRARHIESDLQHRLLEQLAVLGLVDRLAGFGADHFHPVLSPAPRARSSIERFSAVWPPSVGSSAEGALRGDDLLQDLEVSGSMYVDVRKLRIRHDRRRIGVHEDDAVALLLERLARLRAGIVELARLADHDGTGANDEDRLDVGAFGHFNKPSTTECTEVTETSSAHLRLCVLCVLGGRCF